MVCAPFFYVGLVTEMCKGVGWVRCALARYRYLAPISARAVTQRSEYLDSLLLDYGALGFGAYRNALCSRLIQPTTESVVRNSKPQRSQSTQRKTNSHTESRRHGGKALSGSVFAVLRVTNAVDLNLCRMPALPLQVITSGCSRPVCSLMPARDSARSMSGCMRSWVSSRCFSESGSKASR